MEKRHNQAEIQSEFTALVWYGRHLLKKRQRWIGQLAKAGHPPAARPSRGGHGCSAPVWPTGSAWDGPCCGAEMAHKVPGCAGMYPTGIFLLLGSFPAMATLPAEPVLADTEQQNYHDVFPLTGCWKKAILSIWDFHIDATIFLKS